MSLLKAFKVGTLLVNVQVGNTEPKVSQTDFVTLPFCHKGALETIVARKMLWRTLVKNPAQRSKLASQAQPTTSFHTAREEPFLTFFTSLKIKGIFHKLK